MHRIYSGIGICYFLLLLTAGFIALAKNRLGVLSAREFVLSIAGLTALEIGAILCLCAAFVIAGGPDGRFMSGSAILYGGQCMVATLVVTLVSLRLLSLPLVFAPLFLIPAILVIVGQSAKIWAITIVGFSLPPVCLIAIVVLWVRQELRVLAP